jgi:hypothetical protein
MKQLIQKRGLNYRKHFLFEDRIAVEDKSIRNVSKYEVKLEDIGVNKYYQRGNKTPGRIIFLFFLLSPVLLYIIQLFEHNNSQGVAFISVTCFACAILFYSKKPQDDIFLVNGKKNLVFYRNVPNEETVLRFIDEIIATRKVYLKHNYSRFDNHTQENELVSRLNYLKNNEIITGEEFDKIYSDFKLSRLKSPWQNKN